VKQCNANPEEENLSQYSS